MKVTGHTAHLQAKVNGNVNEELSDIFDMLIRFDGAGYNDRQKITLLMQALFDDDVRSKVIGVIQSGNAPNNLHPNTDKKPLSRSFVARGLTGLSESMQDMFEHYIGRLEQRIAQIESVAVMSEEAQEEYIQQELNDTERKLREQIRNRRGGTARERRIRGDE